MLHLDYRDARPIYEQVKDGLRRLVVTGAIQEGEKLPSVRTLASSLAINPNTIQRAYESLEEERRVASLYSALLAHTEDGVVRSVLSCLMEEERGHEEKLTAFFG